MVAEGAVSGLARRHGHCNCPVWQVHHLVSRTLAVDGHEILVRPRVILGNVVAAWVDRPEVLCLAIIQAEWRTGPDVVSESEADAATGGGDYLHGDGVQLDIGHNAAHKFAGG